MLAGVDSALVFDLGVYLKCQCVCAFFFFAGLMLPFSCPCRRIRSARGVSVLQKLLSYM